MDLGCGAGGLGLELARASKSTVLLFDPDVDFEHVTSPDTFRQWAQQGGLRDFEVARENQPPGKDGNPRLGIWLRFRKRCR